MNALEEMFKMHIEECNKRDERNAKTYEKLEGFFVSIQARVHNLELKAALLIGAITAISKAFDYFIMK